MVDWSQKIKELAQAKELSLRQLAKELTIGHVYLCEVARGSKPASPLLRLRILRAIGAPMNQENLRLLLPDDVLAELGDADMAPSTEKKSVGVRAQDSGKKSKPP